MVAGGFKNGNGVSAFNILTEDDLKIKEPQNLPKEIDGSTMVLHGGSILLCGTSNNLKQCLHLDHGTWKEHSTLNNRRVWHSAVTKNQSNVKRSFQIGVVINQRFDFSTRLPTMAKCKGEFLPLIVHAFLNNFPAKQMKMNYINVQK